MWIFWRKETYLKSDVLIPDPHSLAGHVFLSVKGYCLVPGKCDATAGCDGFSFYRRICYLKTDLRGTFRKVSRTTFIRKQPVRPGQCSEFTERQANVDLAGILVKPPVYAAEQEDCCKACATVPECEGFSYFRDFCYLKGRLQGTYPKSGCAVQVKGSRRLGEVSPGLWV